MKSTKTLIYVFTLILCLSAQSQNYQWASGFGSNSGFGDAGNSVTTDASGNVYVTGQFIGTIDFDPGVGVNNLSSAAVGVFFAKYDAAGNYVWAKKITTSVNPAVGHDIAVDGSGNVYICGYFAGSGDFDPGAGSAILASNGDTDIFFAKYDSGGNYLWAKSMGAAGSDHGKSIAVDALGDVYVTGFYGGTVDFDASGSTFNLVSAAHDVFILKYSTAGNFVWAKSIGGSSLDWAESIALDNLNNILICGQGVSSTVDFDPGVGTYTIASLGNWEAYVAKYDNNGNFIWANGIGSTGSEAAYSVGTNSNNEVFVTGNFQATVDFDPGPGFQNRIAAGSGDGFLAKYSSAGSFMFANQFGGSGWVTGMELAVDQFGNVLVGGSYDVSADFDPGVGTSILTSTGNNDLFFGKYDPSGNLAWVRGFGSVGSEGVNSIAFSTGPSVIITGYYGDVLDFDPGVGVANLAYAGNSGGDIFIAKYSNVCTIPVAPGLISGSSTVCGASSNIYSIAPVPDATTYTWSLPGGWTGTSSTNTISIIAGITGGDILVAAANACGTSSTQTLSVISNPLPTVSITGDATVCVGYNLNLTANGATSYTWSNNSNLGSISVSPSTNTIYTLAGSFSTGCQSTASTSIVVYTTPVISVNSGSVCAGDTFTLNPTGADSYAITGGTTVVNPLTTTAYSIVGTSTMGCVSLNTAVATVTVEGLPVISANNGSICAGQIFTITPSGADNYAYSSVTNTVSPAATTVYSVTGTSSVGCASANTATLTLTVAPLPTVSASSGSICLNQTFTITPAGADTYAYSSLTNTVSPTATTIYSVTGTSSVGCASAKTATLTLTVVPLPTVSATGGSICLNQTFTIVPSGAALYGYSSITNTVSPAITTIYSVTGTSSVGCASANTATLIVTVAPLPTVSASSGSICMNQTFTIVPSGAALYGYSSITNTVSPTATTIYSVTGTSSVGCASANTATLAVTVAPLPTVSASNGSICLNQTFTIMPSGAALYGYSSVTNTVSPASTTVYSVTGTSSVGCASANTATLTVTVAPLPTVSASNGSICLNQTFTIVATGAALFGYSSVTNTVSPLITTNYSVTGTSSVGCLSATPAIVTVSVVPLPTVSVNSGSICLGGTFTLLASGASTYIYSGGSATVSPPFNSSYSVTGTSVEGCISYNTAISTVTVAPLPIVNITGPTVICDGSTTTLTAIGASTYIWNGVTLSPSLVVSPNTNTSYSVSGTDANGCKNSAIQLVTVNPLPNVGASATNSVVCAGKTTILNGTGAITYVWSGSVINNTPFSPAVTAIYTVTGTDLNGCQKNASILITVNNLPNVSASASSTAVCSGSSVSLIGSGANTYTWTGGLQNNTPFFPTLSGGYTVTATDANGCINSASIQIVVNSLPPLQAGSLKPQICVGESVTITVSGANTYTWVNSNDNSTSIIVSPAITTNYTVSGTDLNGCSKTLVVVQNVDPCTGMYKQSAFTTEIRIYPNPNSGNFTVDLGTASRLIIYNVLGELIYSAQLEKGSHDLNLENKAKGLYYLHLNSGGQQVTKRIIVQ